MNLSDIQSEYICPYQSVRYIYRRGEGFIAWRRGTGDNVELLHIKTLVKKQGIGRKLVYAMLEYLRECPPYHSVFGFTRVDNEEARAFYGALGFSLQEIAGVYADGRAILFYAPYKRLLEAKNEYEKGVGE